MALRGLLTLIGAVLMMLLCLPVIMASHCSGSHITVQLFSACLGTMAGVAQRLPVRLIPEQLFIAAMWLNVVNTLCRLSLTHAEAHSAQWVFLQESCSSFAPVSGIATPMTVLASLLRTLAWLWVTQ